MKQFRLFILLVCMAFSATSLAQELEFRLYDVAPSYREEVYGALVRSMVNTGMASSVELLPTGQILINAKPEAHEQAAVVLDAIRRHEAEPTPRVTLQYWVVLGTREEGDGADTPAALNDVLDEVRDVHGPLSFQLLGNATLVTDSGMGGSTEGELGIRQTAYVQGTRLHAELSIGFSFKVTVTDIRSGGQGMTGVPITQMRTQGLSLNTSMEQGEFVVVGENSVTENLFGQGEIDGTFFYIVHWPRSD